MRVEVLEREEIEEKMLMTPGDIVMMLNEMGGMRVQATSPSLGAASVRVQGMRGRYTRFLSDGLPLFGEQPGGLGLLQIPPMDLGQVEVIKGVASALYGAGAMGGVIDLVSRRPGDERGARGPAQPLDPRRHRRACLWLVHTADRRAGASRSSAAVIARHKWTSMTTAGPTCRSMRAASSARGCSGRTAGASFFATVGLTAEDREGRNDAWRDAGGYRTARSEALDTPAVDGGSLGQLLVAGKLRADRPRGGVAAAARPSFGDILERDRHDTLFGEVALRGAAGRHTWVAGAAFERDTYDRATSRASTTRSRSLASSRRTMWTSPWLVVSASGRARLAQRVRHVLQPADPPDARAAAGRAGSRRAPASSRPGR